LKYPKSQSLRVNTKARSSVPTPIKLKRDEVATINIVLASVEEMYFIVNLEYRHDALSRGIPYGLPIKSQCSIKI
jgi:hypothetical protein